MTSGSSAPQSGKPFDVRYLPLYFRYFQSIIFLQSSAWWLFVAMADVMLQTLRGHYDSIVAVPLLFPCKVTCNAVCKQLWRATTFHTYCHVVWVLQSLLSNTRNCQKCCMKICSAQKHFLFVPKFDWHLLNNGRMYWIPQKPAEKNVLALHQSLSLHVFTLTDQIWDCLSRGLCGW